MKVSTKEVLAAMKKLCRIRDTLKAVDILQDAQNKLQTTCCSAPAPQDVVESARDDLEAAWCGLVQHIGVEVKE